MRMGWGELRFSCGAGRGVVRRRYCWVEIADEVGLLVIMGVGVDGIVMWAFWPARKRNQRQLCYGVFVTAVFQERDRVL